ncbi:hypothetical protein SSP24_03700 [Streptomyces spinoverrucosus]|uniref:Uncharacterized protein n=1 Tax=Streptomyces spinoverrucosus TaxID=284043 RepID=A0A4Y3V8G0_9ACTN|nr:hypothetical protein SSP24_03700 [Streptomyces spinoverrucosus]GHB40991.1 hypothetical protein GCM10010397_08900 [Streptomyces spinoverrucosus]
MSLEDFAQIVKPRMLGMRQEMCRVPRCGRPAKSAQVALCDPHHRQRVDTLKLSMADFIGHPAVILRASTGQCEVAVCYRLRDYDTSPYCQAHSLRLKYARRRGQVSDEEGWRRRTSAINADRELCLRGSAGPGCRGGPLRASGPHRGGRQDVGPLPSAAVRPAAADADADPGGAGRPGGVRQVSHVKSTHGVVRDADVAGQARGDAGDRAPQGRVGSEDLHGANRHPGLHPDLAAGARR